MHDRNKRIDREPEKDVDLTIRKLRLEVDELRKKNRWFFPTKVLTLFIVASTIVGSIFGVVKYFSDEGKKHAETNRAKIEKKEKEILRLQDAIGNDLKSLFRILRSECPGEPFDPRFLWNEMDHYWELQKNLVIEKVCREESLDKDNPVTWSQCEENYNSLTENRGALTQGRQKKGSDAWEAEWAKQVWWEEVRYGHIFSTLIKECSPARMKCVDFEDYLFVIQGPKFERYLCQNPTFIGHRIRLLVEVLDSFCQEHKAACAGLHWTGNERPREQYEISGLDGLQEERSLFIYYILMTLSKYMLLVPEENPYKAEALDEIIKATRNPAFCDKFFYTSKEWKLDCAEKYSSEYGRFETRYKSKVGKK
jgi:hypothetical protein